MCRVRERLRVSDPFIHAYACTGSLRCAEWAKLARFYRAHNAELFRLIGRDMRWEEDHVEKSGCGKAEL